MRRRRNSGSTRHIIAHGLKKKGTGAGNNMRHRVSHRNCTDEIISVTVTGTVKGIKQINRTNKHTHTHTHTVVAADTQKNGIRPGTAKRHRYKHSHLH